MQIFPAVHYTMGGIWVDYNLMTTIPGLYAIGNTSGDLYAVDYPINMPGNSNGRCLTWGWLVGKTVAAN